MTDSGKKQLRGTLAAVLLVGFCSGAGADVVSDEATAIVVWPDVVAVGDVNGMADIQQLAPGSGAVVDTIIQLSNTSEEPVLAHCFYENANYHCSNTGEVCLFAEACCDGSTGCGLCEPGWLETDFRVRLTPRQPLGWVASEGLSGSDFPLTGAFGSTGPDGSSNAGSRIPPVSELPYNGVLKCIAINDDGTPSDRNVLKGESTRLARLGRGYTVAKHNAVGLRAIEGAVNDDRELILGGGGAEYEGCPEVLIVDHLFDGVHNPALDGVVDCDATSNGNLIGHVGGVATRLTLVPCTQDLLRQIPGSAVVQYLVYNEFEQRFSTSRRVDCKFERILSTIDTNDRDRSIFSAGVAGSVAGQSRLRAIGSGLLGIATEGTYSEVAFGALSGGLTSGPIHKTLGSTPVFSLYLLEGADQADVQLHQQGDRAEADVITLP